MRSAFMGSKPDHRLAPERGTDLASAAQVAALVPEQSGEPAARAPGAAPEALRLAVIPISAQHQKGCVLSPHPKPNDIAARDPVGGRGALARICHTLLGSARASRAACGASPQSCIDCIQHAVRRADVQPVGEAPTGTRAARLRGRLPTPAGAGPLVLHTLPGLEGIRAGLRRAVPRRHRPVRDREPRHPGFPVNGVQPTAERPARK